jgi:hypothetical protein
MAGYKLFTPKPMSWTDAFLNASMILSGMGPVENFEDCNHCDGAKIFAGLYALYSGLALISIAGVMLSPVVHRFLHKFHLDAERSKRTSSSPGPTGEAKRKSE